MAAAHREGRGEVHLQVHPAHRELEEEMVAWAEDRLAIARPTASGACGRRSGSTTGSGKACSRARAGCGQRTGASRAGSASGRARWPSPRWRPATPCESLRPGDRDEALRIAALLNGAFGRTGHDTPSSSPSSSTLPTTDPRLHLVAEAPDGSFAAHVGVTLEPVEPPGDRGAGLHAPRPPAPRPRGGPAPAPAGAGAAGRCHPGLASTPAPARPPTGSTRQSGSSRPSPPGTGSGAADVGPRLTPGHDGRASAAAPVTAPSGRDARLEDPQGQADLGLVVTSGGMIRVTLA